MCCPSFSACSSKFNQLTNFIRQKTARKVVVGGYQILVGGYQILVGERQEMFGGNLLEMVN